MTICICTHTGSVSTNVVKVRIQIEIEQTVFDADTCRLRVSGKNVAESKHLKLGQYHTIELDVARPLHLFKERWDNVYLNRVHMACDPAKNAGIAAVVMQPGLCHVCIMTKHVTYTRAKIEVTIPKKRVTATKHDKALDKFFDAVIQAIDKFVDFNVVEAVLLGSPGFLKDDFYQYMLAKASAHDLTGIKQNKQKFVLCHCSSGHKHAIKEIMQVCLCACACVLYRDISMTGYFIVLVRVPPPLPYGKRRIRLRLPKSARRECMEKSRLWSASSACCEQTKTALTTASSTASLLLAAKRWTP
jgi:stalled ribosome rescue protein Dom34